MVFSVAQAAARLGVNHERVRHIIASGVLKARKLGGQWLVEGASLERLAKRERPRGRPYSAGRAWGLLMLADGREPEWLSASERSLLRRRLREYDFKEMLPRFYGRAEVLRFRAHPSDLDRIANESGVVRSGISAVEHHGLDLIPREELDLYVPAKNIAKLKRKYFLQSSEKPNLNIRSIAELWPFNDSEKIAPLPVVGIDLALGDDPRAQRVGQQILSSNHND